MMDSGVGVSSQEENRKGNVLSAPVSKQSLLFYVAFALLLFAVFVRNTTFGDVVGEDALVATMKCVKIVAALLLAVKFVLQGFDLRRTLITAALVFLGFVTFMLTNNEDYLFFSFLFIGASKDIKVKTLAKVSLSVIGSLLVLTVFFSLIGVLPMLVCYALDGNARYSMGFAHPNTFGLMIVEICLGVSVLLWGKRPISVVCIDVLGSFVVYLVAHSRTSMIVLIFMAFLSVCSYVLRGKPRVLVVLSAVLYVLVLALTFVPMVFFDPVNSVLDALDTILSYRLDYIHQYYERGVLLFGGAWESDLALDMAFGRVVFKHGVVAAVVFIALIAIVLVKAYKEHCFNAAVFGLTIFIFYGLSEAFILRFSYNYFLIAVAPVLFGGSLFDLGPSIGLACKGNPSVLSKIEEDSESERD